MKRIILLMTVLFSLQVATSHLAAQPKKAERKNEKADLKNPKMKKDGTPDMRYKGNKEAAKPQGPLKKDGTPDKRYKENKAKKK